MSFEGVVHGASGSLRRPIEVHLLGPLEVSDGSRAVLLRRRRERVLLAVLALRAGELVPADVLVEEIWGGEPPRTARAALYNHVSQLRKKIGDEIVRTGNQGYILVADPDQVDVLRFERLVAKGRAATSRGDRLAKLRDALRLWRGQPLADFLFEPFAISEATRLRELYVDAREELVAAELDCGASASLIPELEALVAEHPFRERLTAQLMVALYRSGRQAEALERYSRTRKTFVELLGIDPGPELQRVHHAILCQDASLDDSSRRARTGALLTAVGVPAETRIAHRRRTGLWARSVLYDADNQFRPCRPEASGE
jgi:DNA-binding SARP family transcriptional activator